MVAQQMELLRVEGLRTRFVTRHGVANVVNDVTFWLSKGERVGLVGESGSGKSVMALSIMRLVRDPPGKIVAGRITFEGRNLLELDAASMRELRGNRISMIFQDPVKHLDPVMTAGAYVAEALGTHKKLGRKAALIEARRLLKWLKVPSPDDVLHAYPHQLSGGMCQRVLIATAIATEPSLIIADEATSALDATVQASILRILKELSSSLGTAMLITTHNMLVVRMVCTRVLVMYAGRIVENCDADSLFDAPMHPYTRGLLNSRPAFDKVGQPLIPMPGEPALPTDDLPGCAFYARCPARRPVCHEQRPNLNEVRPGHWSACFFPEDANRKPTS